jgi:hypothetical protein
MNSPAVRRTPSRNPLSGTRLESLEVRCLLNAKMPAQITIQEAPSTLIPGTSQLLIQGTKKSDSISISDNGTGNPGNIFVSTSSGQDFTSTGAVTAIDVATGNGNDHVTYELDSNLTTPNQELVFVGSGARNGRGTVQFTVNIVGAIEDGSNLVALAVPGAKNPTMLTVNDSGEIDGDFSAGTSLFGDTKIKPGPEKFSFQSTAKIGSTGTINTGLSGGPHNDVAQFSYSGTNNGQIEIEDLGNGGSDQLSADVYMVPGSTGTVGSSTDASVIKGSGKDRLSFTVEQGTDTTTATNIFAEVIGTTKKDKVTRTANVFANTKGEVTVVE